MTGQNKKEPTDYSCITEAIKFLCNNFKLSPKLSDVAKKMDFSPSQIQRMFISWAGVSSKTFMKYISLEYTKNKLKNTQATLTSTDNESDPYGKKTPYKSFVKIERMTSSEYKDGGVRLKINYSFATTPFGDVLIASSQKGICNMVFIDNRQIALAELISKFPKAQYHQIIDNFQKNALFIFTQDWNKLNEIRLHLHGTAFQLKVWKTLLTIPFGEISSYRNIANQINNPKAYRAVGTAIGHNPIAVLIPCHRIICSNGELGHYHWGNIRKIAILGWEAAKLKHND